MNAVTPSRTWGVLLAVLFVVVASYGLFAGQRAMPMQPQLPEAAVSAPVLLSTASLRVPVEAAQLSTKAAPRTVRDYLRDYYGDEWPAKAALFEEHQKALLDRELSDVEPIRPWEEVAEQLAAETLWSSERIVAKADAALQWDPNTDSSWENIAKVFSNVPPSMGQRQLLEFQSLAKSLNEPIHELALQQNATVADTLACKWAANRFSRGPYSLPWSLPDPGRRALVSISTASKTGWCVSAFIYVDELPPGFEDANQRMAKMIDGRTGALSSYLASFK